MAARFRSAELGFTAVRELTRVATVETERAWLEAAGSKTTRQIERLVAGHASGDRPNDPVNEEARRHRVVLELSAKAFALFRDAKTELLKATGHGLDNDAFITLLRRALLHAQPPQGGETEPPQGGEAEVAVAANYRIALMACPGSKKTVRTGGAQGLVVEPHVLDTAMCSAEVVSVETSPRARRRRSPRGFSARPTARFPPRSSFAPRAAGHRASGVRAGVRSDPRLPRVTAAQASSSGAADRSAAAPR